MRGDRRDRYPKRLRDDPRPRFAVLVQISRDIVAGDLRAPFGRQRVARGLQALSLSYPPLVRCELAVQLGELLVDVGNKTPGCAAQHATRTTRHDQPPSS